MLFSDYCYRGLYSEKFELLYCDCPFLFRRLSKSRKELLKRIDNSFPLTNVYHSFKADGINYLAKFCCMVDCHIVCWIAEEIPKETVSTFTRGRRSMRRREDLTMAQMIMNYLDRTDFLKRKNVYDMYLTIMPDIYDDYSKINEYFENKEPPGYIQLRKWLIHTADVISYAAGPMMKRVSFSIDLFAPYAKLDYSFLELSVYNLARLAFFCTCEGSQSRIEITSYGIELVDVSVRIPYQQNISLENFRMEMCSVKHFFKLLGGKFDFYEQDGFICGTGFFKTSFSFKEDKLDPLHHISTYGQLSEIMDKRKNGKFRKIYFPYEKNMFRTPVEEFSDYIEDDLLFALFFFRDIKR